MKFNEMKSRYLTIAEAHGRCGLACTCSTCMYCVYPEDGEHLVAEAAINRHENLNVPWFCSYCKKGDLAQRIDEVIRNIDPYEYMDRDGSLAEVEKVLKTSPETIIDYLLNIIEKEAM